MWNVWEDQGARAGSLVYGLAGLGALDRCENYASQIYGAADRYGIDRGIAIAQLRQESGCNPNVCSGQGACGIAQFIPGTWETWGRGSRSDVAASLEAWGKYMSHLLTKFSGDYRLALAGYHSGERDARAALRNCAGNPKTCNYVNSIMAGARRSIPPPRSEAPDPGPSETIPDLPLPEPSGSQSLLPFILAAGILTAAALVA